MVCGLEDAVATVSPVDPFERRILRARTWITSAEQKLEANDLDHAFIDYWCAFNAAYGQDSLEHIRRPAKFRFKEFFGKLLSIDHSKSIHSVLRDRFTQEIRVLLGNRYVFMPFWEYQAGIKEASNWERRLQASNAAFYRYLHEGNTLVMLDILFDRLYVLRNQLMHGGARWNSDINRSQVRDGVRILARLVPLFVDLMENGGSGLDWGPLDFPPLYDPAGL